MADQKPHDPELEAVIQRCKDLRITMTELCEYTGVYRTTLRRWRYSVSARHAERQAFLERAERLIEQQRAEYMGA